MGRQLQNFLRTRNIPWRLFRRDIRFSSKFVNGYTGITGTSPWHSANLCSTAFHGSWEQRARFSPVDIDALFKEDQGAPNNLAISPWMEKMASGGQIRFRVDAYRGVGDNMERICDCSAIIGGYTISAEPYKGGLGLYRPGSSFFINRIIVDEDYGHSITVIDDDVDENKTGDQARAGLIINDLKGITHIAINIASTAQFTYSASYLSQSIVRPSKMGFVATGW